MVQLDGGTQPGGIKTARCSACTTVPRRNLPASYPALSATPTHQLARPQRHALRMVACRAADHAARQLQGSAAGGGSNF